MRCARIWFEKKGRAKYISHLDLVRCMTRAVRRAGVPLWYTEGFNPHPYLQFPLPLPLGQESEGEPLDIRVEGEDYDNETLFRNLSAVMPENLGILKVTDPAEKPDAIAFAKYAMEFVFEDAETAKAQGAVYEKALADGSLTAEKLGKKGRQKIMKVIALGEHTKAYALRVEGTSVLLDVTLSAGIAFNLNPALLADSLQANAGLMAKHLRITRKGLLNAELNPWE